MEKIHWNCIYYIYSDIYVDILVHTKDMVYNQAMLIDDFILGVVNKELKGELNE